MVLKRDVFFILCAIILCATISFANVNIQVTVESPFTRVNEYFKVGRNGVQEIPAELYGLTMIKFNLGLVGELRPQLDTSGLVIIEAVGLRGTEMQPESQSPWNDTLGISCHHCVLIDSTWVKQYCSIFFIDTDGEIKFNYVNTRQKSFSKGTTYPGTQFIFGAVLLPYPEDLNRYNIVDTDIMTINCWSKPIWVETDPIPATEILTEVLWDVYIEEALPNTSSIGWAEYREISVHVPSILQTPTFGLFTGPNQITGPNNEWLEINWDFKLSSTMSFGEAVWFHIPYLTTQLFFQSFDCQSDDNDVKYDIKLKYDFFSNVKNPTKQLSSYSSEGLSLYVYLEPKLGFRTQVEPIFSCSVHFKVYDLYSPEPSSLNMVINSFDDVGTMKNIDDGDENNNNNMFSNQKDNGYHSDKGSAFNMLTKNQANFTNNHVHDTELNVQDVDVSKKIGFSFKRGILFHNKINDNDDVTHQIQTDIPVYGADNELNLRPGDSFTIFIDTLSLFNPSIHPSPPFPAGTSVDLYAVDEEEGANHHVGKIHNWQWQSDRTHGLSNQYTVTVEGPIPFISYPLHFIVKPIYENWKKYNSIEINSFDWMDRRMSEQSSIDLKLRVLLTDLITFLPTCWDLPPTSLLSCGQYGQCNGSTGICDCEKKLIHFDSIDQSYQQCPEATYPDNYNISANNVLLSTSVDSCPPTLSCGTDGIVSINEETDECYCECPTIASQDLLGERFYKDCRLSSEEEIKSRELYPNVTLRPLGLDQEMYLKLSRGLFDRNVRYPGATALNFNFGSLLDFYTAKYDQVKYFTFNWESNHSLLNTYNFFDLVRLNGKCLWYLFTTPNGFLDDNVDDTLIGVIPRAHPNQDIWYDTVFYDDVAISNPFYQTDLVYIHPIIQGLSTSQLANTRLEFQCGVEFDILNKHEYGSMKILLQEQEEPINPSQEEYLAFLESIKINFAAYSLTIRHRPRPKSVTVPIHLRLTKFKVDSYRVHGWSIHESMNTISFSFDMFTNGSVELYDSFRLSDYPGPYFQRKLAVVTVDTEVVDKNGIKKRIISRPIVGINESLIVHKYCPYSPDERPTSAIIRFVIIYEYTGRASEFAAMSDYDKLSRLINPAAVAQLDVFRHEVDDIAPILTVPTMPLTEPSLIAAYSNPLFYGNVLIIDTGTRFTHQQRQYHELIQEFIVDMTVTTTLPNESEIKDDFVLGHAYSLNDGFVAVQITTVRLTLPNDQAIGHHYEYFINHDVPVYVLNAPNTELVPYCFAMSLMVDNNQWDKSPNGICANNAICSSITGFCQCQTPATVFGDICDGHAPDSNDDVDEFCSLRCKGGKVPNSSCSECICRNGFTCNNHPQSSILMPDDECLMCFNNQCNITCTEEYPRFDENDCSCKCPLKKCNGAKSFHNPQTCECECPSRDDNNNNTCNNVLQYFNSETCQCECSNTPQCQSSSEVWDATSCECKSVCTNLTCRNGGEADINTCKSCICPTNTFWLGSTCETCGLRCGGMGRGKADLICSKCDCLMAGYSGTLCECHRIESTIILGSVPMFILNTFIADPITGGSSQVALNYMRDNIKTNGRQRWLTEDILATFTIKSIKLISDNNSNDDDNDDPVATTPARPQRLHVECYVEDNCGRSRATTNYPEVEAKWTEFLNSLVKTGLTFHDNDKTTTTIPVIDIEISYPNIQCDEVLDVDCDNVIDLNNAIGIVMMGGGHFNLVVMMILVMVSLVWL